VEDNDPETAYEYPTDVGDIDLLAKHRTQPRWLVVELKRGQTSDDTVGQILRYIGWIRKHLAKPKESVEGLIIARSVDDNLRYAASEVPHVKLMEYQVSFHLHAPIL
jgi:RecB family endonuclease NucS